jgi:hypothetical protein
MADTTNVLKLSFLTDIDEKMEINIPRADTGMTYLTVAQLMNALINCGIIQSTKGKPVQAIGATLVATGVVDIELA